MIRVHLEGDASGNFAIAMCGANEAHAPVLSWQGFRQYVEAFNAGEEDTDDSAPCQPCLVAMQFDIEAQLADLRLEAMA